MFIEYRHSGILSILELFPANMQPRPVQAKILQDMEQAVKSGYKRIILCAPTGSGKSPVAVALAARFKSSFVVTASKSLQDQYSRDFKVLRPVKGKDNFACLKQMEWQDLDISNMAARRGAMDLGMTCSTGECVEKVTENGKERKRNCKFKPDIEDDDYDGTICPYYEQKYDALRAPHSIWNYSAYFQIMKFNQETYGPYLNRQVSIFDEAHTIEDQILGFIGIRVTPHQMEECGVQGRDVTDVDGMIGLLDSMATYYAKELRDMETSPNADALDARIRTYQSRYDRLSDARVDIVNDRDNFVIDATFDGVSALPLDISKYVKSYLTTEHQIFMSATIHRDAFCETMGFDRNDTGFIDVEQSPFKPEHRSVEFRGVGWLKYNTPPDVEAKLQSTIDEIMTAHADHRGLILTSSLKWCNTILSGLTESNKARVRLCHAMNPGGRTQAEVLEEHAGTPGSVLLSSSLWQGVDLKDDLSRFQIIAKVPYPSLASKRTKIKKDRYPLWYGSQTLTKVLQGVGRSIRNEHDWAKTYVLDSAAERLISNTWNMVPKSYHDVLER